MQQKNVFLPFSTLKQMKNNFDFYEEYLKDYVFDSPNEFNFYFDVEKFKAQGKHKNLLNEYMNDYRLKYFNDCERNNTNNNDDLNQYVYEEVFDFEVIRGLFCEFGSYLLWSNNFSLLKGFCANIGVDIIDSQII